MAASAPDCIYGPVLATQQSRPKSFVFSLFVWSLKLIYVGINCFEAFRPTTVTKAVQVPGSIIPISD